MGNPNLTYALKEDQAVHVSEVESGLKCGCICPACGKPLMAKRCWEAKAQHARLKNRCTFTIYG